MTAQKSTNNFLANLLYRLKANRKTSIIILILHLISGPLLLINAIIYTIADQKAFEKGKMINGIFTYDTPTSSSDIYSIITIFATPIAGLCGIFIAINIFNYLYKKSMVDMHLSLPLTTKQRFFSDFFAGLISYIAPFLVSTIFTTILSFIYQGVLEKSHDYVGNLQSLRISIPELAFYITVCGFFIMIMTYVLTVLALTYCGNILEAITNAIGLNILIPATIYFVGTVFLTNLYGINLESNILPFIYKTSPAGGLYYVYSYFNTSARPENIFTSWLIPFFLVTAFFFVLSYILYIKRKAEDVSKPFVYKGFFHIIMVLITFIIVGVFFVSSNYNNFFENIIPIIIITAIVWLIVEVITNRGYKKIWKAGIRYVITLGAILTLVVVGKNTGCFGMVYNVPSADDVKSISINYSGVYMNFYNNINDNNKFEGINLEDKASIKDINDLHKDIIEKYKETKNDNPANAFIQIQMKYYLKNGTTEFRTYGVTFEEYKNLSKIDLTDEYINEIAKYLKKYIKPNSDDIFPFVSFNHLAVENNNSLLSEGLDLKSYSEINDFVDAICADLKALSPKDYYTPSKKQLCSINFAGAYNIEINENYTNTIAFLKNKDIEMPQNDISMDVLKTAGADIIKLSAADYQAATSPYSLFSDYKMPENNSNKIITHDDWNELKILFEYAQQRYCATDDVFLLGINHMYYIIPQQYNDIAKKYAGYHLVLGS